MPTNPNIYHITHLENLSSMIEAKRLWSDSERIKRSLTTVSIGYAHIKERRRTARPVSASSGGNVGDYVPFYFCPRSIMLYVIHRANAPDLAYRGGQEPIVHLVSTVGAAAATGRPWTFTEGHADLLYRRKCYEKLNELVKIDWAAVAARDWSRDEVMEKKQAEFLVRDWFPWSGIERIGVLNEAIAGKVRDLIGTAAPVIEVHPDWYY